MSTPVEPVKLVDTPPTNWRNIVANIVAVIVAVLTALPVNESKLMGSAQIVAVFAILQTLLRVPFISAWLHENQSIGLPVPVPPPLPPKATQLPADLPTQPNVPVDPNAAH